MDEYTKDGGRNLPDFVHGMNYLIDYIERGEEEKPLNDEMVDILVLKHKIERMEEKNEALQKLLKKKENIIKQFRQMNKGERKQYRREQKMQSMEKAYSRLVSKLLMNDDSNNKFSNNK